MDELQKLESCTYTSRALEVARDYLVVGCRTGQRISDIKRFDIKDLQGYRWTFYQKKGNRLSPKKTTVHLDGYGSMVLDILQKYNWKMPVISEQKLNDNIKKACKAAGIDTPLEIFRWAGNKKVRIIYPKYEFISSHIGRKSFITLALQAGLDTEYVMELAGITEYKTVRHYKAKFEDQAVKEQLEKITVMRKAL
jgi:integrase